MAFEWWEGLSGEEKLEIIHQSERRQDEKGHCVCFWCGAPIKSGSYDYTSSAKNPREICKGYCRNRRYFDNPEV